MTRETHFRMGQAHSYGSSLQFLITVIGDWLPSLHSKELPKRQTSELNTTSTQHSPASNFIFCPHLLNQCYIFTSATSSNGIFWWRRDDVWVHLIQYVAVVSNTSVMRLTDTAAGWRWDPFPCWRRIGLLHLLWEANCRGEGMNNRCWMKGSDWHPVSTNLTKIQEKRAELDGAQSLTKICNHFQFSLSLSPLVKPLREKM